MSSKKVHILFSVIIFLMIVSISFPVSAAQEYEGIFKIGGDVLIPGNTSISGDAVAVFGSVKVRGNLSGNAVAVMGDVIVEGVIEGDAISVGGKVLVREGAKLGGEIVQVGPGMKIPSRNLNITVKKFFRSTFKLFNLISAYALGILVLALFPNHVKNVTNNIDKNLGREILIGLAALILIIPLIVLTALSIIGIPLIPLILIIFTAAVFLGYLGISFFIGGKIEELGKWDTPKYVRLIIGITVLWVAKQIPLVVFIIVLGTVIIGLGAVLDTRFGTVKD